MIRVRSENCKGRWYHVLRRSAVCLDQVDAGAVSTQITVASVEDGALGCSGVAG